MNDYVSMTVREAITKYGETMVGVEFHAAYGTARGVVTSITGENKLSHHDSRFRFRHTGAVSGKQHNVDNDGLTDYVTIIFVPPAPAAAANYEVLTVRAACEKYGAALIGREFIDPTHQQWGRLRVEQTSSYSGGLSFKDLRNGGTGTLPSASAMIWLIEQGPTPTWKPYEDITDARTGHEVRVKPAPGISGNSRGGRVVAAVLLPLSSPQGGTYVAVDWGDGHGIKLHQPERLEYDASAAAGDSLAIAQTKELPAPEPPPPPPPPPPELTAAQKRFAGLDFGPALPPDSHDAS